MPLKSSLPFLKRFNFESLYNTFLGLQPREQIYALAGAGVALLLIIALPISLASSKLNGLEEELLEGRKNQREILKELKEYQELKSNLHQTESRITEGYVANQRTTLFTLGEKNGIHIGNFQDKSNEEELFKEIVGEFRISKVTLPQLIEFLYDIEYHPKLLMRVKELKLKRTYGNKQLLDVPVFSVATYQLQKPKEEPEKKQPSEGGK